MAEFPQLSRCQHRYANGRVCGRQIARVSDPHGDFWQHTYAGTHDLPPQHDAIPECNHPRTDVAGYCHDCGTLICPPRNASDGLEPFDLGPEDVRE